ncbi:hypothetical protein [Pseudophaeobacter sp. EL27]|uniref:hypothetical protein n=1 Tax=Pseudophaeobacter sp. EL27 TaxID=2107580 RepID=UPI000EFCEDCC|nr:hypothetical protein [Pseudophaeobacter sp. EL27]
MPFTSSLLSLLCRSFAIVLLLMVPQLSRAETGPLLVELNKMEEIDGGGCRAFFLFRNQTGKSFAGFEMSLAILNGDGIIDRLLSVDASPLPVQRTTLKLFEVPEISCGNISEILLHDVTSCQPQNEAEMDCFPILTLGSRASAKLVK